MNPTNATEALAPAHLLCRRCGQPFTPKPTKLKTIPMTRCCETCACRNLLDGLDLPTPPSLLDRQTKHPTFTDAEWLRKSESQDGLGHDHKCYCGTATHAPHETATCGCVRFITESPVPSGTHETLGCPMWEVGGRRITDFTLRQQRGYWQHPCGCWSTHGASDNSIAA